MTGMAFKQSDVDCFILIHPEQMEKLDATYKDELHSQLVNTAKKILRRSPNFSEILAIPRASVPIVKLFHLKTQINCDISFKNGFGIHNSKLISFLLSSNTRLKPLTIFIKYWAKTYFLTGPGRFSNYAIILLIIFFLQQVTPNILVPVCNLQNDNRFDIHMHLWNCGFDYVTMLPKTENSSPVLVLLRDFFGFYKEFDFSNNVICPFVGKAIPVTTFDKLDNLLPSYQMYVEYARANTVKHITSVKKCIYVQDPFEHNRNCTSSICSKRITEFTHHCKISHEIIENALKTDNYENIIKNLLDQKLPVEKKGNKQKRIINIPFPKLKNATFDRALLILNMKTLFTSILNDMLKCSWTLKIDKEISNKKGNEYHVFEFDCHILHNVWSNRKEHAVFCANPLTKEIEITNAIMKKETTNSDALFTCVIVIHVYHNFLNIIPDLKCKSDNNDVKNFIGFLEAKLKKIMVYFFRKQTLLFS